MLLLASFPVPRPAFRCLQYGKAVLQATKSWAWDWVRGYVTVVRYLRVTQSLCSHFQHPPPSHITHPKNSHTIYSSSVQRAGQTPYLAINQLHISTYQRYIDMRRRGNVHQQQQISISCIYTSAHQRHSRGIHEDNLVPRRSVVGEKSDWERGYHEEGGQPQQLRSAKVL